MDGLHHREGQAHAALKRLSALSARGDVDSHGPHAHRAVLLGGNRHHNVIAAGARRGAVLGTPEGDCARHGHAALVHHHLPHVSVRHLDLVVHLVEPGRDPPRRLPALLRRAAAVEQHVDVRGAVHVKLQLIRPPRCVPGALGEDVGLPAEDRRHALERDAGRRRGRAVQRSPHCHEACGRSAAASHDGRNSQVAGRRSARRPRGAGDTGGAQGARGALSAGGTGGTHTLEGGARGAGEASIACLALQTWLPPLSLRPGRALRPETTLLPGRSLRSRHAHCSVGAWVSG
mmetsp:Transcript_40115/g.78628  ORF Transcript_40115/g.78628 Transcript_40115/m.78628 type:complete len:289 (-) Transcript_40115:547-1413(-)